MGPIHQKLTSIWSFRIHLNWQLGLGFTPCCVYFLREIYGVYYVWPKLTSRSCCTLSSSQHPTNTTTTTSHQENGSLSWAMIRNHGASSSPQGFACLQREVGYGIINLGCTEIDRSKPFATYSHLHGPRQVNKFKPLTCISRRFLQHGYRIANRVQILQCSRTIENA